ncbi:hypothetical protein MTR67_045234 [Solanum verrucosum]|uniref:Uncharacterized protein n=1 Tax=Solanum verrucosum TaxID=315347 RepID=A0AAF0UU63_SOLVR|nr:hypothetical protein MTR67_045234 [Solanum verrucosum]
MFFDLLFAPRGIPRHHDLSYSMTPGDEVEDMFILLNEVKRQIPSVTAVSSGAIASDYQSLRVESLCSRIRDMKSIDDLRTPQNTSEKRQHTWSPDLHKLKEYDMNARIVLDEFQIVLHSPDSIAPVGILHPLAFHLENKVESISSNGIDEASNLDTVFEVEGDVQQEGEAASEFVAKSSER